LRISIITVNFNQRHGLEKTIKSVLAQTFTELEYIVIDGYSTDGSIEVINEFNERIDFWISERDHGVYDAMNKGIRRATGEYILFLNSGDYFIEPNVLVDLINGVDEQGFDLIYGNMARRFPDQKTDVVCMPNRLTLPFLMNATLCHPVTLIKKELFDEFGLYDTKWSIVADWVFFLRLFLQKNVKYLHKNVTVTMFSMDGMSSKLGNQHLVLEQRKAAIEMYVSEYLRMLVISEKFYRETLEKGKLTLPYRLYKKINHSVSLFNISKKNIFIAFNSIKQRYQSFNTKSQLNYTRYQDIDFKAIPIIVNNRNRLTYLLQLIQSLEKRGYTNIHIIDNASDYKPLLDFYKQTSYPVYYMPNMGYCALWDSGLFEKFKNNYYVYTDSDLEIEEGCPDDFMKLFFVLLNKYPDVTKVGFGLKIDDIPETYCRREEVIKWESRFFERKRESMAFEADIDTTFALYRPSAYPRERMFKALRTSAPYIMRHLPWYEDSANLIDEQAYYYQTSTQITHWKT